MYIELIAVLRAKLYYIVSHIFLFSYLLPDSDYRNFVFIIVCFNLTTESFE